MQVMKKKLRCGLFVISMLFLFFLFPVTAAADQDYVIPGTNYVLDDSEEYQLSKASKCSTFFYGNRSMGTLRLVGAVSKVSQEDKNEYGVNGSVSIYYTYDGGHQDTSLKKWYVDGDAMGKVNGYDFGGLFKGVGHGCVLIEESDDAVNWTLVRDPKLNYFTGPKKDSDALIYSVPEEKIKNGRYFRVLVAYRFCRKTAEGFAYIGDSYEYKKCIEVYQFYICSDNNHVTIRDMGNGTVLSDQAVTETGFIINKNGSTAAVTIQGKKENDSISVKSENDFDYFTDPGEYSIEVTTKLGTKYKSAITITKGIDFKPLEGKIYWNKKEDGYKLDSTTPNTVFGGHLTSLFLSTPKGSEVVKNQAKYGITGKSVSLYMQINKDLNVLGNQWVINPDTWGNNTKDKIDGITPGEIGKGALIIQTSKDGKNWNNADNGRYADGLYTTDYLTHYGQAENVLIYTPSGEDVINGIHVRVLFAYQVYHEEPKDYRNYVELYQFYLCSNELGAVKFHNLSVSDSIAESYTDEDQNNIEVYKMAETLLDGGYTTTGFKIDKSLNPTVLHTVAFNGTGLSNSETVFTDTGKYTVYLTSAVESRRIVTIYVDRMTPEEAMNLYFGDGFISGKRIYSEGEYPVYESGKFSYHLSSTNENVLPLYGQITNLTNGSVTTIEQNSEEKNGIISEPGDYQAIFATSEKAFTGELAGDARVFTFQFQVIPQGTAPGPFVNRQMLDDYSHTTTTDSHPVYYGLTYSSAGKGNITLAFASKKEAVNYAYQYEKGTVEDQGNGEYRYNGSFIVDQKTKFDSAWDLTDAVNYFAEAAVQKHFFDMSDEFTYLSLKPDVLESNQNLRQLELQRSVVIFADNQRDMLTDTEGLPFLNDKPYAYLNPETSEVERGFYSFEFVTDKYGGLDSKNVVIIDGEGKEHSIRYSESAGHQLYADNCPSGIVTVHEETMYGDTAEYQAVYIAPNDNSTELALTYTLNNASNTTVYEKADDGAVITVDSFMISSLTDPLDPYAFVIVNHKQYEYVFTAKDDSINTIWSDPGEYRITCRNRLGYGYSVSVTIESSEDSLITDQNILEIPVEPVYTPEPIAVSEHTADEPGSAIPATDQPDETSPLPEQEIKPSSTEEPNEKPVAAEKKETDNNTNVIIVVGTLAVILLIAVLIIINRRNRLFSRVSENLKGEEESKHE